ncbi:MAG: hypothetical protein PHS53_04290 [Candidatus Pacebacteria bacterium]|nr:hypothetical protein [Candidatus Paceibacterota bacterium]MDD5357338.1 hypothetical protein [Candidatus Paceibacterota bacterium]
MDQRTDPYRMEFEQVLSAQQRQVQELAQNWDKWLEEEFALAPQAIVDQGLLTKEVHQAESWKIGDFCVRNMLPLLEKFHRTRSFRDCRYMQWTAVGKFREVELALKAIKMGFEIIFRDVSSVACENARRAMREHGVPAHTNAFDVREGEFQDRWSPDGLECLNSGLFYAGQWVQLLSIEEAEKVMGLLGAFLCTPKGFVPQCDRRVCLVHPLPEDNVGTTWKHSTPYSADDMVAWASKGNGKIRAEVAKEKCEYYGGPPLGHVYSFIVLSADV